MLVLAKDHRADGIAFEIQRQAEGVVRKLEHLALHRVGQSMHATDAVGKGHDRALRPHLRAEVEVLDLGPDELADFRWIQLHDFSLRLPIMVALCSGSSSGQVW